jgi:hypothetical protein
MGRFVDLRSATEVAMEERGRRPLDGPDEAIAQKLAQLVMRTDAEYSNDKPAYERTKAEIEKIGNDLCRDGGDARMRQVALRMKALGGRVRTLEMYWNGICGWMS